MQRICSRENYRLSKMAEAGWQHYQPSAEKPSSLHDEKSLSAIITQTAQERQITITSLSPDTERHLQLRTMPIPYATAFEWIQQLETRYGVVLIELDMNKTDEGATELRMTLEKPELAKVK